MSEADLLRQSLVEARAGAFDIFRLRGEASAELESLWSPPEPAGPLASYEIVFADISEPDPSPWAIAFTSAFRKSMTSVDRKLQGRLLTAITHLSEAPLELRGDTVKPLTGELKGLWRYRLGGFRLVYEAREAKRLVVLIGFGPRGGIYDA
jgi:mRNA-degrading endonuclease RelE of RelBE toxin-antitoxin system